MCGSVGVAPLDDDLNLSVLGAMFVDVIDQPIRNPTHRLAVLNVDEQSPRVVRVFRLIA